ncbi:Tat pathway signal sequence domain protein [Streptomyces sp. NPDC048362]|uniref:Tat pathway signal sequence domain protein n=1 Tax=Streptomyces sp. NPDC048362 TaxID=3365539 RepID=UPI00372428B2
MSGIGPLEPGEGTRARDNTPPPVPRSAGRARTFLAAWYGRNRRTALTLVALAVLLGGAGALFATRPRPAPPPSAPRPAQVPYPAQAVAVTFLDGRRTPAGAPPRSFSFAVLVSVESGPPVTVTRVTQPYDGLSLRTDPVVPFRTKAGSARKITITMHVTHCRGVPMNAGLPFLDVTLRNTRAIQIHGFILGSRYARHLSRALKVACSNSAP